MGNNTTIWMRAHNALGSAVGLGINSRRAAVLQDTLSKAESDIDSITPRLAQDILTVIDKISTDPRAREAKTHFGSSENSQTSRINELRALLQSRIGEFATIAGPLRDLQSFTGSADSLAHVGDIHFIFNRHDLFGSHLDRVRKLVADYDIIALENMALFLPYARKVSSGELDVETAKIRILSSAPAAFNSVQIELLENTLKAIYKSHKTIVSDPNDDIATPERQRAGRSFNMFITALATGKMSDSLIAFRDYMKNVGEHLKKRDELFSDFISRLKRRENGKILVMRGAYHTLSHELTRSNNENIEVTREFLSHSPSDSFERSIYTSSIHDLQRGNSLSDLNIAQAILSCLLEEYFYSGETANRTLCNTVVQRLHDLETFEGLFARIRKEPLLDHTLETDYLRLHLHSWLISLDLTTHDELAEALGSKDAVYDVQTNLDAARAYYENKIKGVVSESELKSLRKTIIKVFHPDRHPDTAQASKAETHFKALKTAVELREKGIRNVHGAGDISVHLSAQGASAGLSDRDRPEYLWTALETQTLIRLIGFDAALEQLNTRYGPVELDTTERIRMNAQHHPDIIGAFRSDGKPITFRELYSQYIDGISKVYYTEWSPIWLFDPGYQIQTQQRVLSGNTNTHLDEALHIFHRELHDDEALERAAINLFKLAHASREETFYVSDRLRERMIFRNESIYSKRSSYAMKVLHWLGTLTMAERAYNPVDLGEIPEEIRGAAEDIPRYTIEYDPEKHNVLARLKKLLRGD